MIETKISAAFYRGDKSFVVEQTAAQVPNAGEVAVRVAYCGICGTDMHVYHGNMDARVGLNRVVGHEMSGTVEAIGANVTNVKMGQKVVVRPLDHCNDCPACDAGHFHICHQLNLKRAPNEDKYSAFYSRASQFTLRLDATIGTGRFAFC